MEVILIDFPDMLNHFGKGNDLLVAYLEVNVERKKTNALESNL